jgi:RNA polymerase sigma factor (sigma-70 family)
MPLLRNDPQLLAAFRGGHRDALATVYRFYARPLDNYFRALARRSGVTALSQASVAQDLLQEAFIRAFSQHARQNYDATRDFSPYLKAIARNTFIDALRKRKHEIPFEEHEEALTLEDGGHDDTDYEPEVLAALETYLRQLAPELRDVYEQRFERGLTQEAACQTLGVSRRSLRTLEEHLRRGLRKALFAAGLLHAERPVRLHALEPSRE